MSTDNVTYMPMPAEHARMRARLADSLDAIAGHIRRGELEADPCGWMLVLRSDDGYETLHVNFGASERIRACRSIAHEERAAIARAVEGGAA